MLLKDLLSEKDLFIFILTISRFIKLKILMDQVFGENVLEMTLQELNLIQKL